MLNVKKDFPIFMSNEGLVFLDSAASAQKPQVVIDAVKNCYEQSYSNIHRGVYKLSEDTTEAFEGTREKVQKFINADSKKEIIFTKSATEAINLVATSFGETFLKTGDEILISEMEHHANIVPWQMLRDKIGIKINVLPITDGGVFSITNFAAAITPKTKLVAITHMSNVLGTINPAKEMVKIAHENGAKILLDGAQAICHMKVDMQNLNADFYVFSSHKIYAPSGVGVLYAKAKHLEKMPPYQSGGDMVYEVTFNKTTFAPPPAKFEAGTPNIEGVIGLGAAIDYINNLGMKNIIAHEDTLLSYATEKLSAIEGLKIIGTAREKAGVISFIMEGIHPHDIGTILATENIALRVGHHCAQPVMARFNIPATTRMSLGIYNQKSDIDAMIDGIYKVKEIFD